MRYRLGRLLQLVGLIVVPQGIALNLFAGASLWTTFAVAGVGCAIFYLGRFVQGDAIP